MILTKKLTIKVNRNTIEHYSNLGYEFKKMYDFITIDIEHLTLGSKYKIDVKCDICNQEKEISYKDYNRITKKQSEKYYCSECKNIKTSKTCIKKYGVDNVFKVEKFKEKQRKTCIEKYGVDNVFKVEKIKEKQRMGL